MIESIMYFAIGFFAAGLTVLVVVPLVHGRAARLTTRRLEAALPASVAEVCADKDLLRAEFAVSTRRLEFKIEQLTTNSASQRAELGRNRRCDQPAQDRTQRLARSIAYQRGDRRDQGQRCR